jgi:YD repeat-containing protein
MKKIFHSFLIAGAVSALIFSSGCKKAASIDGHVLTRTQATTPTGGATTTTTINYTYDSQGRQTSASPSSGNPTQTSYGSGSVTQITGSTTVIYQLNSAGLATSDNNGTAYTYDNNGYLTNETQGQANSINNTITSGNLISEVVTAAGSNTATYTYVYGTTQDYRNFGLSFLGKRNVDLPTSESGAAGTLSAQWVYTYVYDSKGRVTQETVVGNGETNIYTFTYTTN